MAGMKKILFIAKMNDTIKSINTALSADFSVQVCSPSASIVRGMVDVVQPDLVLVSLMGLPDGLRDTLLLLRDAFSDFPVVTLGTAEEKEKVASLYTNDRFSHILDTTKNSDLLVTLGNLVGLDLGVPEPESAATDAAASSEGTASGSATPSGGKKNVMIIDDNAATLRNMKSMLEDRYDITIVPSGVKAMAMIAKRKPDLILLDYEMPVVDGRQTLQMIRDEEEYKDIPVIFLTGVSDKEHIVAVMDLKPRGYILKPPVQQKLIDEIDKNLYGGGIAPTDSQAAEIKRQRAMVWDGKRDRSGEYERNENIGAPVDLTNVDAMLDDLDRELPKKSWRDINS